jgi:hypothetical protein
MQGLRQQQLHRGRRNLPSNHELSCVVRAAAGSARGCAGSGRSRSGSEAPGVADRHGGSASVAFRTSCSAGGADSPVAPDLALVDDRARGIRLDERASPDDPVTDREIDATQLVALQLEVVERCQRVEPVAPDLPARPRSASTRYFAASGSLSCASATIASSIGRVKRTTLLRTPIQIRRIRFGERPERIGLLPLLGLEPLRTEGSDGSPRGLILIPRAPPIATSDGLPRNARRVSLH